MTEWVRYTREGAAGIVTLDRPPLNLIDRPFLDALMSAFRQAKDDAECRAVILESALPGFFCAGLDLKALRSWDEDELRSILNILYLGIMDKQATLGKPTIAAPAGMVRGGGITLCIQCDVIIPDAEVDFAYSEIDAGLLPAIHLSHLPRQVGRHQAFAPLFTGGSFGAEKALQLGLAERIAAAGTAGAVARELAQEFASKPPHVMRLGRDAFHRVNDRGHRHAVGDVIETFIKARFSADGEEGIAAFTEKRKPIWPGG